MTILIFALVLILILALAIYAVDLVPMDARLKTAVKIILIVIAILLLCQRSGML
jgi:hypothetical protein